MKYILYLTLFALLFTSCKSGSSANSKNNHSYSMADKIVNSASKHIGAPYKMAGKTAAGFDCSGLVYSTFNEFEVQVPRTSYDQAKIGKALGQNFNKATKGDLIFFKTNNSSRINHVGIITEANNDEIKFIHSSTSRGVIISSTKESYYQRAFTQINRILE
ncbi:C40 family peptidase [Flavobacterium algicola]|uniref:C40 family peptidase n=1 Tax=Flavobacterium algicola TaxID=556529 RepID=UPI001EFC6BF8|nr:C40 family peptidase [Flavobacterium algicola]MCG9794126.1 C40 family peptidase [Flavobacterium algicola]